MHEHSHAGKKNPVYSHLGLNRVISGMPNNQETERRCSLRIFFASLLQLTIFLRPRSCCVCACLCARARVCIQAAVWADCCDTTESVTNQLEKHRWDVPNVFLWQGWTGVQWAAPWAGELAGGLDECAAGFPSATGAWLELRAYKFQPGEEKAAGVCVQVCLYLNTLAGTWRNSCARASLHTDDVQSL